MKLNSSKKLNETVLKRGLEHEMVIDQRPYIVGSVDLVKQNIIAGGALAVIVLILFLRAISPTAVVSIAIPISVIEHLCNSFSNGKKFK